MTAEEVLAKAADHIEHVGWMQIGGDSFGRREDQNCAAMAIFDVGCDDTRVCKQAINALAREIQVAHPNALIGVFLWNDRHDVDRHIVAATIRNARRWLEPTP